MHSLLLSYSNPGIGNNIHGASFASNTGIETITFRESGFHALRIIANILRMIPTESLRRIIIENINETSFFGHELYELLNDPHGSLSLQGVIVHFNKVALGSLAYTKLRQECHSLEIQKRLEFGPAY